mgnify:FL=1
MQQLIDERVAEISHRSAEYNDISRATIEAVRTFFAVPQDYAVLYASSATEAMQCAVMNLVKERSAHFSCGSFSELFASVSASLGREVTVSRVEWGLKNDCSVTMPADAELITVCANETSTGLMLNDEDIASVRQHHPEALLAVDITSIAGLKNYPISGADVWLFSVQKCLGLPAGLGMFFLSPRAVERAASLKKNGLSTGPFSISAMMEKMQKYQTIATPNVLAIALLGRTLERWNAQGGVAPIHAQALSRATALNEAIARHSAFTHFVSDEANRSCSVHCFAGDASAVRSLHEKAMSEGILLGKGYGKLKENTFRIANFPAVPRSEWDRMCDLFRS